MRDILPDEMDRVRAIDDAFAHACGAWGYREVRTPLIEQLHLFTAAGELSPQTLDRVYSFLDWDGWSGERVVLRPDSTIPTARLYAENLRASGVARLFYSQNVFRFTDDGSSREEWQCGVEMIGNTGVTGDVELALLALEVLRSIGVQPALQLSHAGVVRAVLAAAGMSADEQSRAYDRLLDGDLSVVDEVEQRLPQLNAPLRLLFEVEGAGSGYVANLRQSLQAAIPALAGPLAELAFVVEALEAAGETPAIHAVLARSFEYYSGVVTSLEVEGLRVGGGGRYDDLIGLISGEPVPASGFALFVAPLAGLLPPVTREPEAQRVAVQPGGEGAKAVAAAFAAASRLRRAGMQAEVGPGRESGATALVRCDATSFTGVWPDGDETFASIDELILRLERPR